MDGFLTCWMDKVECTYIWPLLRVQGSLYGTLGSHNEKTVHMIFDVLKKNALYFCEIVMALVENPENELRL